MLIPRVNQYSLEIWLANYSRKALCNSDIISCMVRVGLKYGIVLHMITNLFINF